jgi:hypothetical protein
MMLSAIRSGGKDQRFDRQALRRWFPCPRPFDMVIWPDASTAQNNKGSPLSLIEYTRSDLIFRRRAARRRKNRRSLGRCRVLCREEVPLAGYPFEYMHAPVSEPDARARHKVLHRARYDDFAPSSPFRHPSADVHGDPVDVISNDRSASALRREICKKTVAIESNR